MDKILHEIDMNILKHKIKLIKQNINKLDESHKENTQTINEVNRVYDKLLLKDKPVGSALNVVKHNKSSY